MTKMNWGKANRSQRAGKAQSAHADADHPPGIPSHKLIRTPEQEEARNKKINERKLQEQEIRNARRVQFLAQKEELFQQQVEILECKPDGSNAWSQLQKLKEANPDEAPKYWEAYHRLSEILNFN